MNTPKQNTKGQEGKPELPQHTWNEQGFCIYCHNVHRTDGNARSTCSDGFTCNGKPELPQHSPLPWSVQNGAIYDAQDNGRVQNVRLCGLVASSTAITPQDAKLIVRAVNHADALAEALRIVVNSGWLVELPQKSQDTVNRALANWEAAQS